MWSEISDFISQSQILQTIVAVANSNITVALLSAFAGAYIARHFGDKSKQHDDLRKEIRNTNAAIVITFNICNTAINFKKQLVQDTCNNYWLMKSKYEEFVEGSNNSTDFSLIDLRTLNLPFMPIEAVRSQFIDKISISTRPLCLLPTVAAAHDSLARVLDERRRLIQHCWANKDKLSDHDFYNLVFGMPMQKGSMDTSFPDSVSSLQQFTDDLIFFSFLLCEDLVTHGKKIFDENKQLSRKLGERIYEMNFNKAHEERLIPDASIYEKWLSGFPDSPKPSHYKK